MHALADAEIADPKLAQVNIEVGEHQIEELLRERRRFIESPHRQTGMQQHEFKSALRAVWHA